MRGLVTLLAAALLVPLTGRDASAARARPFFGVHVRSIGGGDWSQMRRANVGTVRTAFNFSTAKRHEHAAYEWDRFDRIVRGTARERLALLPVLYCVPSWVPEARKCILEQPVRSAWRRYVEALIRRYGSNGEFWAEHPRVPYRPVRDWQVWNEPNSFVNWPEPDPHEYGRTDPTRMPAPSQPASSPSRSTGAPSAAPATCDGCSNWRGPRAPPT